MKSLEKVIPYVDLAAAHASLRQEILEAVDRVLRHGQFILGPEVVEFENEFARRSGVNHAIGVANGTDALVLALKALGIGSGDEVITPPNSFVASTSCIELIGARAVFVDVGEDYTIDVNRIESAITARTKAILPVHLTGKPANMTDIGRIAEKHELVVVEDAAQAVLAQHRGRPVGSWGAASAFSLHPLKTLNACGDAGIITTNDAELADRLRVLRNLGLRTRDDCVEWAPNSRLDTLQAAILLVKMRYVDEWTEKRRSNAARYRELLSEVPEVVLPVETPGDLSVYHTFVIQAERRDDLKAHLQSLGIGTSIHYPVPIHLSTAGRSLGYRAGSFPHAEAQASKILSLPVYETLADEQLERICEAIAKYYREGR